MYLYSAIVLVEVNTRASFRSLQLPLCEKSELYIQTPSARNLQIRYLTAVMLFLHN